jgi:hypothetical protein
MLYRFVHHGIDFVLGDVADFLGATIQQCFELRNYSGFTFGGSNLLWWNGYDADLFVSADRPAENLLNGGLERPRHLTGFVNGDILHCSAPLL